MNSLDVVATRNLLAGALREREMLWWWTDDSLTATPTAGSQPCR